MALLRTSKLEDKPHALLSEEPNYEVEDWDSAKKLTQSSSNQLLASRLAKHAKIESAQFFD